MTSTRTPRKRQPKAAAPRGHEIVAAATAPGRTTVDIARKLDTIRMAYREGVLSKDERDERMAPLIGELRRAGDAESKAVRAAIPFGVTLGTPVVVAGELIESAWGNQVRTDLLALNAGKLELSGGTLTGNVAGITPVNAAHLTRKDYVDAAIATAVADRVADTGDTITGILTLDVGAVTPLRIRRTGNDPFIDFQTTAGARLGYVKAESAALTLESEVGHIIFMPVATDVGRIINAALLMGKTASNLDNAGTEIFGTGSSVIGAIRATTTSASFASFYSRHMGSADTDNAPFATFARTTSGTVIGSIIQDSTTGVEYVTTSGRELKVDKGPVADAIALLRKRAPRMATFKAAKGAPAQMVFYAEDWMDLPGVTVGKPGQKQTAAMVKARGYGKVGDVEPMMMDYGRTTPLIAAATLENADEIAAILVRLTKAGI